MYLDNVDDFAKMNAIYGQYFPGAVKPARTTIQQIAPGTRDPDANGAYPTLEQVSFVAVRSSDRVDVDSKAGETLGGRMRPVRLLFSAVVLLVPVMLYAQTPPDSVMEVLRQKARPGMVGDYEANRKKHMAWHTAQKDPWTWEVFQIMTGPDTGG